MSPPVPCEAAKGGSVGNHSFGSYDVDIAQMFLIPTSLYDLNQWQGVMKTL